MSLRIIAPAAAAMVLVGATLISSAGASADANVDSASCMGLGSSFYARFATQQRAHVAHLVKDYFAENPGAHYRTFAHEKEGGSIPSPCGTAIE